MKRTFTIELFRKGAIGACYTVLFEGERMNEAKKFEKKHKDECETTFFQINARLNYMLNRNKFLPPYVKLEEGSRDDRVIALPTTGEKNHHGLRWYGLKFSDNLILLGNGGIKTTNTYQEDDSLHACVKDLQYIDRCIEVKEESNEIVINLKTYKIEGDLNFPKEYFEDISYPKN